MKDVEDSRLNHFEPRRQLDQLQRQLGHLREHGGENSTFKARSAAASQMLQEVIRKRRERERLFGDNLFSDPAWDILLDLFQAHTIQQRVATSDLGRAAAIPPTTALRWIDKLEECGWVIRNPDPLDGRRVFVELSPKALDAMESYLAGE